MKWLLLLLFLLIPSPARATKLCDEVRLALVDALKLPKAEVHLWRYVTTYNLATAKDRELHEKIVLAFQLNSLSRKPEFALVVKVGPTLYRVNLFYYGIDPKTYENLAKANPYFPCFERIQVQLVVPAKAVKIPAVEPALVPTAGEIIKVWVFRNGFSEIHLEEVRSGEKVYELAGTRSWREIPLPIRKAQPQPKPALAILPAPPVVTAQEVDPKDIKVAAFLPAKEMYDLATLLQTRVPLIRVDWFFYRTSISVNRQGDGYYDFLGIKSRDDAYKLAGLDLKEIARLQLDLAAMLAHSGVAVYQSRQVWWVKTYAGSWWQTFDVGSDPVGKKNLIRLHGKALDKVDFDHDAEEIYFTLSNRLWGVLACDKNGVLQGTVPDNIASDDTTTSKDKRIHTSMSCFRCHEEGLRPINDWGREVYRKATNAAKTGQALLGAPDPKQLFRLKQLYLSDLPDRLETDQQIYARRLKLLNGLTPKENAAGVGTVWRLYADTPLGMEDISRELGVEPAVWTRALRAHVAARYARSELVDPLLVGLLAERPQKLIRPHVEELYPVMQAILREGVP